MKTCGGKPLFVDRSQRVRGQSGSRWACQGVGIGTASRRAKVGGSRDILLGRTVLQMLAFGKIPDPILHCKIAHALAH